MKERNHSNVTFVPKALTNTRFKEMFHCAIQVDHPAPAPGANVIYPGMAVDKCTSIPPSPPLLPDSFPTKSSL